MAAGAATSVPEARPWDAPVAGRPVTGRVDVPGSKSETNRALVLAAVADGPCTLTGALDARDSRLMRAALIALGARIDPLGSSETRVSPPEAISPAAEPVDVGLAGNVMRFVPPLAALAPGRTRFVGDPEASRRPVAPLLDGLRQLGVGVDGDRVPFAVSGGTLRGRRATIDASESSQFVSGLLLAAPRFPEGLELHHRGAGGAGVPSRPHIDMTVAMLAARGVTISCPDEASWSVAPGPVAARDQRIEPDLTNAAVFLAVAAATGGEVVVPGWPSRTTQGGDQVRDLLARMGAEVRLDGDDLHVRGTGGLVGVDADLHESSELTPVAAALGALAEGTTTIRGVAHIRGHETDRLAALATELARLGVQVEELDDGLRIAGRGPGVLHGTRLATYADHRLAHAAALLGAVVPGVSLDDVACTSKTLPDFPRMWSTLLGGGA
ncbi:MAG TPA: 3-phosphoshikimate 1-carboxyvinyltransferase [Propionibacteriaceae bacterium]|nr:3-phosphoshikimate 1-carboxyvinyltransferase [Propionibacteriaceae bacterium]